MAWWISHHQFSSPHYHLCLCDQPLGWFSKHIYTGTECRWRVIFNIDEPYPKAKKRGRTRCQERKSQNTKKPKDLLMIIRNRFFSCWIGWFYKTFYYIFLLLLIVITWGINGLFGRESLITMSKRILISGMKVGWWGLLKTDVDWVFNGTMKDFWGDSHVG